MLTIKNELLLPKNTITITNKHAVFKDTEYKTTDFSFDLKQPNRKDSVNILSRSGVMVNGELSIDNGEISKSLFTSAVQDWSGLQYEDGSVIECTEANKEAIWEAMPDLTDLLQKALNEHIEKQSKIKRVVKKKS